VFVLEQARRLQASFVTINTLKPGPVRTSIRREFPLWMKVLVPLLDPFLTQSPDRIAVSALRLLTGLEFEGVSGKLFTHILRFKPVEPAARMRDPAEGARLWALSELLSQRALEQYFIASPH
jgi:hypothetical protein